MKILFLRFVLFVTGFGLTSSLVRAMPSEFELNSNFTNVINDKDFAGPMGSDKQELKKDFSGYYVMPNRLERIELSADYNCECAKFINSQPNFVLALKKYIKPFPFASEREKKEGCCFFYVNFFLQEEYPDLFQKITITLKNEGRWSSIDSIEECFHDLEFDPIKKFIDEFMVETDTPQAGDLILYYEGPQDKISSSYSTAHLKADHFYDIRHVGIMNSSSQVRSKWGWYDQCIYVHDIGDTLAEYGSYVKFWTLKPEYHMYRVEKNQVQVIEASDKNSTKRWCTIL